MYFLNTLLISELFIQIIILIWQGGESTIEEMCLSFPVFYPRPADGSALISCSSTVNLANSLNEFATYVIT